ncbi:MAG: hypothetical protein K2Z81_08065 [Cyanobacteria bacterium]|nr:hypothetical protein [Cyanobacteriota bacterium]
MKSENESAISLLDQLMIAAPCSVSWDSMTGDDRVRHCAGCSKNVYNVSDMTYREANDFLRINGATPCMTFYRRKDGTIITDNCPVGLRKLRDRYRRLKQFVASMLALVFSSPHALAQQAANQASSPAVPGMVKVELKGEPAAPHHYRGNAVMINREQSEVPRFLVGKPSMNPQVRPDPEYLKNHGTKDGGERGPGNGHVKLRAEVNVRADSTAYNFYKQAKEAEADDDVVMASFFYKKALAAFDKQKVKGDLKFRELIEHDQRSLPQRNPDGSDSTQKTPTEKSPPNRH